MAQNFLKIVIFPRHSWFHQNWPLVKIPISFVGDATLVGDLTIVGGDLVGVSPLDPALWPAISQRLESFRPPAGQRLRLSHQDFSQWASPIVGQGGFALDPQLWPGLEQLLRSFRAPEGQRILLANHEWSIWPAPVVGSAAFPLDPQVWPGIEQGLRSFRVRQRSLLLPPGDSDFGWISSLQIPPPPPYLEEYWPGIEQLVRSYRALPGRRILLSNHEWSVWSAPAIGAAAFARQAFGGLGANLIKVVTFPRPDLQQSGIVAELLGGAPEYHARYYPGIEFPTRSFRMPAGQQIGPSHQDWSTGPASLVGSAALPLDPQLWPGIEAFLRSFRTVEGRRLGLAHGTWFGWPSPMLSAFFPLDAQRGPGIEQSLHAFVVTRRPSDIPAGDVSFGWVGYDIPAPGVFDDRLWPGIECLLRSFRTAEGQRLLLPSHEWSIPSTPAVGSAAFPLEAQLWPAIEQGLSGFRTRRRPSDLPAGDFDFSWVGKLLAPPPAFDASLWPGIESLRSERVRPRPSAIPQIDPDQGWIGEGAPIEFLPIPSTQEQRESLRLREGARLRPSDHEWIQATWQVVGAAGFPLNAFLWPGIEALLRSFRSATGRQIGAVHQAWNFGTPSAIGAAALPLDPQLWPGIEALLSAFRLRKRPSEVPSGDLDFGWIGNSLTPPPAFDAANWPGIEQLLRSFRAAPSSQIGLSHQHWSLWPSPIVGQAGFALDAQLWPGIEQLLRSFRSAKRQALSAQRHAWSLWPSPIVGAAGFARQSFSGLGANLLKIVTFPRPDLPQDGWLTLVPPPAAFDATLFPGIAQLRADRTGSRLSAIPAGDSDPGWIGFNVPSVVAPEVFTGAVHYGEQVRPRPILSLFGVPARLQGGMPLLPSFRAATEQSQQTFRTPRNRAALPASGLDLGWLGTFAAAGFPFDSTVWAAIESLLRSFRVDRRLAAIPQGQTTIDWIAGQVVPLPEFWRALEQVLGSFGMPQRRTALPQGESDPGWIQAGATTLVVPEYRSPIDQPLPHPRRLFAWAIPSGDVDQGWITANTPPAFTEAEWPGIEQGLHSFRMRSGPRLDLTSHEWTQPTWPIVGAARFPMQVFTWPGIDQVGHSFMAGKRPSAIPSGDSDFGWVGHDIIPPPPLDPTLWPGIEPRSGERVAPARRARMDLLTSGFQDGWVHSGIPRRGKLTASGVMGKSKYMAGYGVTPHPFGV